MPVLPLRTTDLGRGECRERVNNGAISSNKTPVKVSKTQKTFYLPLVARLRQLFDYSDLLWIHPNRTLPKNEPVEGDLLPAKLIFLNLDK